METHRGDAATFHARSIDDVSVPSVWWFDVVSSALVLGSAEPIEHIDLAACAEREVAVVRRRSGGGAVLLEPGDAVWVDVVLPVDHPQWMSDVSHSAWWLGEVWREALADVGVPSVETSVHRGPMVRSAWSDRVCFLGRGGGEVMAGERKMVGISQRRTRTAARFQCALYRHWRPDAHVGLFSSPGPTADELSHAVHEVDVETSTLRSAFEAAIERSG